MTILPANLNAHAFRLPDPDALRAPSPSHSPRILLLYGSVRERSYSRFLTLEAQRLLDAMGAETRVFHADGLPLPDDSEDGHPKVAELREAMLWSEGQVWTSPERHGAKIGRAH
ncbi:MAG: NAD(P)H-dependent oxidoreductase, partial [Rhizobiaceae bacterium]